jgi:ATP-dependent Lhr-like helicase
VSEPSRRLHPAVQHHVVNSLGWRSLRPLQEHSIDPVLDGRDVLLGAPTAGGKTEAAILPLLSRMVAERWSGLTVLYVCPLRALLNNLYPRIAGYAELVGRTVGLWHGDVGDAERKAILRDPPDILLTTPESLEAMFLSRRVDTRLLLGGVQSVVVDEIHAFAGDDRGWHMLAVLDRIDALSSLRAQRLGLTATVGNPQELLAWLSRRAPENRQVVMVADEGLAAPELQVDWVGSMANAAKVISALHRGEKRLVFCDSRARVEELSAALRTHEVTTFVSHSSLSRDERRQAEQAFAESRDCVIVATSTLELGIDVGDLDRVIQIDAPARVASVLQRIGRTGRRPGTHRNCLFLCVREDAFLQAVALCELIGRGWVEPVVGPAYPLHLAAQQVLARCLSDGRVGDSQWPGPLMDVAELADMPVSALGAVQAEMELRGILVRDGPFVQIGPAGEKRFGRRHFMEIMSLFLTEPLLLVRWGTREIGQIDPSAVLTHEDRLSTFLLGGRAWNAQDIDWNRRIVQAVPSDEPGKSRWAGSGAALSAEVCRAMRRVVGSSSDASADLTARGSAKLAAVREEFAGMAEGRTSLVRDERDRARWWTFAGGRANAALAQGLNDHGLRVTALDDLSIGLRGPVSLEALQQAIAAMSTAPPRAQASEPELQGLKFSECLPAQLALDVLTRRRADPEAVRETLAEPVASQQR